VPRVQSRRDRTRQRRLPLPAQPTTTTRSGTGRVGTRRAVMSVTVRRRGAGSPRPADNLACSHETTNKMGEIVDAVLAQPRLHRPRMRHQAT
jgi:hypothetical protein